jgi:hypothetical protein
VRRYGNLVDLCLMGDAPALGDAAGMFDVRHQDMDGTRRHISLEFGTAEERLAPCRGLTGVGGDVRIGIDLVAWNGFLKPEQVERSDGFGYPHGKRQIETTVAVDEQIDLTADRLARSP